MKSSFATTIAGLAALLIGGAACSNLGAVDSGSLDNAGAAAASTMSGSGTGNESGAASSAGGASGGAAPAAGGLADVAGGNAGSPGAGAASGGSASSAAAGGSSQAGAGAGGSNMLGGAGAGAAGAPVSAGAQATKGLGFNLAGSSCDDLKTLGLSWFYAWSATSPCPAAAIEFVPQIWGSWKKLTWVPTPAKAVAKGAKALLGFNEPDGAAQANLTVDEAIALWPDMNQPGALIGRLKDLGFSRTNDASWNANALASLREFKIVNHLPSDSQLDRMTVQALLSPQALARSQSFLGAWGTDSTCSQGAQLFISARDARTEAGTCSFDTFLPTRSGWTVGGRCQVGADKWSATINFTVVGKALSWSSTKGNSTYYRCG